MNIIRNIFIAGIVTMTMVGALAAQPIIDTCVGDTINCPLPQTFAGDYYIPAFYDKALSLSPDEKMLLVQLNGDGDYSLVDLATFKRSSISAHGSLPGESDAGYGDIAWCPYDPDLVAMTVYSNVGQNQYVGNIFTYRISTHETKRVTPLRAGLYGASLITLYHWEKGSKPGMDSLFIHYSDSISFTGIYIPQTQEQINLPIASGSGDTLRLTSPDGKHTIYDIAHSPMRFDTTVIGYPEPVQQFDDGCFSQNDSLFALEVRPNCPSADGLLFAQLWIYKASDPSRPISRLNFQKLYCKYSFRTVHPVFLTDSTLAISMHNDQSDTAAVYEISINGRLIRQLTFVVTSGVSPILTQEYSLHVRPTISSDHLLIILPTTTDPSSYEIFDALGRVVITGRVPAGSAEFEVGTARLAAGAYVVRVVSGDGISSARFVVSH